MAFFNLSPFTAFSNGPGGQQGGGQTHAPFSGLPNYAGFTPNLQAYHQQQQMNQGIQPGQLGQGAAFDFLGTQPNALRNPFALAGAQFLSNREARGQNQANFDHARNLLMQVPGSLTESPVFQGAQQNMMQLQNNPLTFNDQTKQLMENRASNLVNSALNSQRERQQGELALSGRAGGSAQQNLNQKLEDRRIDELADVGTNIEIQAAQQRPQDLLRAAQAGADFAQRPAGLNFSVAQTLLQNLPQITGDDFTPFLAAYQAGMGQTQISPGALDPYGRIRDGITLADGSPIPSIGR